MSISDAYRQLESEFQGQIDDDWKIAVESLPKAGVYLPNLMPDSPVDYVLIGAEPSGTWGSKEATESIENGFKNFHGSWGDFILHYSIREFLLESGQTYHLTDLSKGAMPTTLAKIGGPDRYDRWFPLLKKELEIVAKPDARVIAIGKSTRDFLSKKGLNGFSGDTIVHYSQQAAGSWKVMAESYKEHFNQFSATVEPAHVKRTIRNILQEAEMKHFEAEILKRLDVDNRLTDSRRQLMFTYKVQFAEIRRKLGMA